MREIGGRAEERQRLWAWHPISFVLSLSKHGSSSGTAFGTPPSIDCLLQSLRSGFDRLRADGRVAS